MELIESIKRQPITLSCLSLITLEFFANFVIKDCSEKLGLVPVATTISNFYFWNLITCSFYETNVIKLGLDILALILVSATMIIDRIDRFLLYFISVMIGSSFLTSVWSFIRFFSTGIQEMLIEPSYGFAAPLMAIIMYQRMRCKSSTVYSMVPFVTYQNLPFLVIGTEIILRLVGLRFLTRDLTMSFFGLHLSWAYLKYIYTQEDGTKGVTDVEFDYYKLYPRLLQPIILPLIIALYNILALTGMVKMIDSKGNHANNGVVVDHLGRTISGSNTITSGSNISGMNVNDGKTKDVVGERRRAKAIKLLEARLQQEPIGWDAEVGNNSNNSSNSGSNSNGVQPTTADSKSNNNSNNNDNTSASAADVKV